MSALLVPIALDALVVRDDTESWALTVLAAPKPQAGKRRRQKLTPDPFQLLPDGRKKGVYLHWALPDALTRYRKQIDPATGNEVRTVWPVPNRWLVLRLAGPGLPRTPKAWLIPDVNAQTLAAIDPLAGDPLPAPGTQPANPLTAFGHGDLGWAGYFDNVAGRLGLYDDLAGVTDGPVAYLVAGWYTQPSTDDPLAAGIATETDFLARMQELAWTCDHAAGGAYPSASVYHGCAVSIGWPGESWTGDGGSLGKELDLRPDKSKIEAAIGETGAEALAALTAGDGGDPGLTTLFEGLFASALTELNGRDGPPKLETALHVSRFGSKPSAHQDEVIWQPDPASSPGDVQPNGAGPAGASSPGTGDVHAALAASAAAAGTPDGAGDSGGGDLTVDGNFKQVKRTRPRVWHAHNPEIVLRGAGRSFRHGGDGRFDPLARLACRLEGQTVTSFGVAGGDPGGGATVLPANALASLGAYGAPAACAGLLTELASLDPGSAPDLAAATQNAPSPVAGQRALLWALRDPSSDPDQVLAGATWQGTLPSPLAVTPPSRPWIPLHIEWSAEYLPSPRGAHDWQLDDLDFQLRDASSVPAADPDHPLSGRSMLSSAPAKALAGSAYAVDQWATGAGPDSTLPAMLGDAAGESGLGDTLSQADLLAGAFERIMEQLRKDPEGVIVSSGSSAGKPDPSAGPRPKDFVALRAGLLRLTQLRLVDGYGQFLDLLPGLPIYRGPGIGVPGQPELLGLRPRFTAPTRVLLRYAAATGAKADADPGVSPVCGYVVPSPLDGTLEFFDDAGTRLGRLRPDDLTRTAWEEDPGQPASLGASPSRWIANPSLGSFADALLGADTAAAAAGVPGQTALEAFLRAVDTTRWTVDVTGRAGDEHLALLLGRPLAVMRATVLLDVQDPRKPPENAATAVPIKLGTLAHQQDGLLAYVVGDDYARVHIVDPAVADVGAVDSPFIDISDVFYVQPGVPVPLVLFVVPQSDVHVTMGLVPQKKVGMLREWTSAALAKLSPASRYGPVLRDPKATRLPVPADVRGTWAWNRRADATTWVADEVVPATQDAVLPLDPALVSEGWLSVTLIPDTQYSNTAQRIEVTHIRSRRYKSGKQLLGIGGTNKDGSHFLIPVQDAARLQETGRFVFFVQDAGHGPTDTKVVTRKGTKYLWTTHDRRQPNNLLSLPEAPADW